MPGSSQPKLETILVVDDSEILRTFVVAVLEDEGFTVISADSGPSALDLAQKTSGKIDLLLTDWDMREMSGIALGQVLKAIRPDIHIMQMSGGAHDSLLVLNYGWAFLQKPFVGKRLIEMINDVLHSPNRAQAGGDSFDSRLDSDPKWPQAADPDDHPTDGNEPKDRGA